MSAFRPGSFRAEVHERCRAFEGAFSVQDIWRALPRGADRMHVAAELAKLAALRHLERCGWGRYRCAAVPPAPPEPARPAVPLGVVFERLERVVWAWKAL